MMTDSGSDSLGDFVDALQTEAETDAEQHFHGVDDHQPRTSQQQHQAQQGSADLDFTDDNSNINSQENGFIGVSEPGQPQMGRERTNSFQARLEQISNSKIVKQGVETAFFIKLKTKQILKFIEESSHTSEIAELLQHLDVMLLDHARFAEAAKSVRIQEDILSVCRHHSATQFSTASLDGALSYTCNEFARNTEAYQKIVDKINAAFARLVCRPMESLVANELAYAKKFRSEYLKCKLHLDNQNTLISGYQDCYDRMSQGEPPFDPTDSRGKLWNQLAKFNKVSTVTFQTKINVAVQELVDIRANYEKASLAFVEFMRIVEEKRNTEIVEYFRMFESEKRAAIHEILEYIEQTVR